MKILSIYGLSLLILLNYALAQSQTNTASYDNLMLLGKEHGVHCIEYPVYLDTTGIGDRVIANPRALMDSRNYEGRIYSRGIFYFNYDNFEDEYQLIKDEYNNSDTLLDLDAINDDYPEIKSKLYAIAQNYGKFKVGKEDVNKQFSDLIFVFDEIVNADSAERAFKNVSPDFNGEFRCRPAFLHEDDGVSVGNNDFYEVKEATIYFKHLVKEIVCYNILGNEVMRKYNSNLITLNNLNIGVYFIMYNYDNQTFYIKFNRGIK